MASMFTFLSVFWWALQRRREREAYYRFELARQLAARAEEGAQAGFLEWLREQDAIEERKRREGLKLGAAVLIATGLGFLLAVGPGGEESIMAFVPFFIGIAMVLHLVTTRRAR
jgi:hypothetical protein